MSCLFAAFVNFSHVIPSTVEFRGLPWWLSCKEPTCQSRGCGFSPWLGRSLGEENGNPLQYSCLGNPKDSGAW